MGDLQLVAQTTNFPLSSTDSPIVKPISIRKKESSTFSQRYAKDSSTKSDLISQDHCYSKNWNSQSDQSHAHTAKHLSWSSNSITKEPSLSTRGVDEDEIIDVEEIEEVNESQFDYPKATDLMTECERHHMKIARPHQSAYSDEPIDRSGWTTVQNKIFNRVYKILVAVRLSKLACTSFDSKSRKEPIQRRIYADKAAKRIRQIFSNVCWDEELLPWLHTLCMDHLPNTMLADYIEVLQTLRAKVPTLIENMITSSEHHDRMNSVGNEALDLLLKRPWDPVTAMPSRGKLEKLQKSPLLLLVPQMPHYDSGIPVVKHHRAKLWSAQLSSMAQIKAVPAPTLAGLNGRWAVFDAMVGAVRACIAEAKETNPAKPIILLGWNFGALLASYVGSMDKVSAVIALGYPLVGVNGLRGDADDIVMDSTTPTLFVIGEHAQTAPIDDLENMRERMRAENDLIVVAGANDRLNVNFKTKRERLLTQTVVDRCIQDEIRSYLERVLVGSSALGIHTTALSLDRLKKKKAIHLITGNKSIATVKGADGVTLVPKKRKSPLKESKARKHMRLAPTPVKHAVIPDEEQLAAISAISSTAAGGGGDPLNLSSSSQGSLASLKPHRFTLPHLSSSSDGVQGHSPAVEQELYDTHTAAPQPPQFFSAQIVKGIPVQAKPAMPTYIQFSGHSSAGQSVAITMERARELLNSGVFQRIERSTSHDGSRSNYDITRQLLSMPTGFANPINHTTPARLTATIPIEKVPVTSQQIRHLLSVDGRLILPNTSKSKPPPRKTSQTSTDPGPSSNQSANQSAKTLSPGQSLIRRLQNATAVSSSTAVRKLLSKSTKPGSPGRAISVVLNSSRSMVTTAGETVTSAMPAIVINPKTMSQFKANDHRLTSAPVTSSTGSQSETGLAAIKSNSIVSPLQTITDVSAKVSRTTEATGPTVETRVTAPTVIQLPLEQPASIISQTLTKNASTISGAVNSDYSPEERSKDEFSAVSCSAISLESDELAQSRQLEVNQSTHSKSAGSLSVEPVPENVETTQSDTSHDDYLTVPADEEASPQPLEQTPHWATTSDNELISMSRPAGSVHSSETLAEPSGPVQQSADSGSAAAPLLSKQTCDSAGYADPQTLDVSSPGASSTLSAHSLDEYSSSESFPPVDGRPGLQSSTRTFNPELDSD